jgi:hypothetical protein
MIDQTLLCKLCAFYEIKYFIEFNYINLIAGVWARKGGPLSLAHLHSL